MNILPKGRSFTANSGTRAAVLFNGRSSTAILGTKAAVILGMDRCDSFPLLYAPLSLFSIWTNLKRSKKIPGAPAWRWGEWFWLTWPSELHTEIHQSFLVLVGTIRQQRVKVHVRAKLESITTEHRRLARWRRWSVGWPPFHVENLGHIVNLRNYVKGVGLTSRSVFNFT